MRISHIVPLAAFSSAFVIPPEETLNQIAIEDHHESTWFEEAINTKDDFLDSFKQHFEDVTETAKDTWANIASSSKNALDEALQYGQDTEQAVEEKVREVSADAQAWFEAEQEELLDGGHHGGHHGGHGRPRRPHDPHHGHKPNLTVYQLIAGSKYTTTLAKLISEYDDLVEALNSTKANYTIFAPTDKAFAKIPKHAPKPSKEQLKAVLQYHVVPDFYPAGRVLFTHTVPTLLQAEHLSNTPKPQRLSFQKGFGITVNYYSRIIAVNIFGTNGVIHGVDSIIIPPPNAMKIIDLLPGEFSTLELGLGKTGLFDKLNTTDHYGGTLFAPSNFAFKKLGPKVNAFLFSPYGLKYLKALLKYHVVPDFTLYSDHYYNVSKKSDDEDAVNAASGGYFHVDLPTLLDGRTIAVDRARYGGWIEIKVNAFSRVTNFDGIAEDGVIQVVSDVLVPPKTIGGPGSSVEDVWQGGEISVEDLMERLEPIVAKQDL